MVIEQAPPNDPEAEATVLASLIVDEEAISRVASFLQPEDFFQERHAQIYEAALALWDRSEAINQVTIAHELQRRDQLEAVGGLTYISHIVAELPTAIGVEFSGKIVQRDGTYRRLIDAAGQIARIGYAGGPNLQEGIGRAEALLMTLSGGDRLRDFVPLRDLLESFLGPPEEEEGRLNEPARTGFADLDQLVGGLKRSDLTILAARPSVGKSSLALAMSQNLALGQGGRVAFFSLEMSAEQLAARLVSAEAMAAKVAAARRARRDIRIVARPDARSNEGLDAAIERAQRYGEAGADVLFVESPESEAELETINRLLDKPTLANMVEGGRTPVLPYPQLQELGFGIAIFPNSLTRLLGRTGAALMSELMRTGTTSGMAHSMLDHNGLWDLFDNKRWRALEDRYGPADKTKNGANE